jgi:hypothetical protein
LPQCIKRQTTSNGKNLLKVEQWQIAKQLSLAGFVTWIHLINHVNATTAAHHAACGMTKLYRLKGIDDFHSKKPAPKNELSKVISANAQTCQAASQNNTETAPTCPKNTHGGLAKLSKVG